MGTASYPMGTGDNFPWGKLTTNLYLVLRLRIRGANPPLLQYVFTGWCLIKQWMH